MPRLIYSETIKTTDEEAIREVLPAAARQNDLIEAIRLEVETHGSCAVELEVGVCTDRETDKRTSGLIMYFVDAGRAALITNGNSVWGDAAEGGMVAD